LQPNLAGNQVALEALNLQGFSGKFVFEMTQSNTPKPLSVDGFLKAQCRENQVNIKGPFQCILKNIISASIAGTSLYYTLLRCPITWLYVMFSQPFKTNLTPLFG